ncbi:MAG: hypothetical protein IJX47_06125 [Clostridia bacterium]|nr:hypothetical protein [Clostridia bacterium]
MANELTITKEQMARYVHDAAEMETAMFTIDRAKLDCMKEKTSMQSQANRILELKASELYNSKQNHDKDLANVNSHTVYKYIKKLFIIIPILILGILFFGIAFAFILLICLIPTAVYTIKGYSRYRRDHNQWSSTYYRSLQCYNECRHEFITAQKEHDDVDKAAAILDMQIDVLSSQRAQLYNSLKQFYDIGIVPPDYRHMDCVIMLDHIFRNNLADTMREAILQYEERVFRGEIVKGMDNIVAAIDRLSSTFSSSMSYLGSVVREVNTNVSNLSSDLYTLTKQVANGQQTQINASEKLIHETQLSRYATEQLIESNKKLAWYEEEKRRQGWF